MSVSPCASDTPPSPSGCWGADKSRCAPARSAPLLRPLPPPPPPVPGKVSGGRGSPAWPGRSSAQEGPIHSAATSAGTEPEVTACTGTLGARVGRTGPWRALDLKPLCLPQRGSQSPVTHILLPRRPEDCKMFACAKLACTPALVRSPGWPWYLRASRPAASAWLTGATCWHCPPGDPRALAL